MITKGVHRFIDEELAQVRLKNQNDVACPYLYYFTYLIPSDTFLFSDLRNIERSALPFELRSILNPIGRLVWHATALRLSILAIQQADFCMALSASNWVRWCGPPSGVGVLSDTGIGSEDQTQSKPCFSSCNDLGGGFKAATSLPR
ncbi:hypothetical protein TNCV_3935901 [Trichonephila clavipes]|nr:hypothetical protein TNCV_3935901 [Trichonephila clavipes]